MDISVLFSNVIGYDALVFICAIVSALFAWRAYNTLKELNNLFQMNVVKDNLPRDNSSPTTDEVDRLWRHAVKTYTRFENVVSLFPTLGIGGTVLALCMTSGDLMNIQSNFFLALTSTFWGLVGTFVFKIVEIFLSPMLDVNEIYVRNYLELNSPGSTQSVTPKLLNTTRHAAKKSYDAAPAKKAQSDSTRKPRNSEARVPIIPETIKKAEKPPVEEPDEIIADISGEKPLDDGENSL